MLQCHLKCILIFPFLTIHFIQGNNYLLEVIVLTSLVVWSVCRGLDSWLMVLSQRYEPVETARKGWNWESMTLQSVFACETQTLSSLFYSSISWLLAKLPLQCTTQPSEAEEPQIWNKATPFSSYGFRNVLQYQEADKYTFNYVSKL